MQVTATWNNGKIELDRPLPIQRHHARLLITVMDEESVESVPSVTEKTTLAISDDLLADTRSLLDRLAAVRASVPSEEDEDLTVEQAEHWAIHEFRQAWRKEQGRP